MAKKRTEAEEEKIVAALRLATRGLEMCPYPTRSNLSIWEPSFIKEALAKYEAQAGAAAEFPRAELAPGGRRIRVLIRADFSATLIKDLADSWVVFYPGRGRSKDYKTASEAAGREIGLEASVAVIDALRASLA